MSSAACAWPGLPPLSIRASTVPTGTVSPSPISISVNRPVAGAGTSESILSVEMTQIVSSASTQSPGCLRHSATVPSATETPICGMTTSIRVPLVLEELNARLLDAVDRRQHRLLERGRERDRHVWGGHAHHRPVEVLEAPLGDDRRHLGAGRAQLVGLVDDHDL